MEVINHWGGGGLFISVRKWEGGGRCLCRPSIVYTGCGCIEGGGGCSSFSFNMQQFVLFLSLCSSTQSWFELNKHATMRSHWVHAPPSPPVNPLPTATQLQGAPLSESKAGNNLLSLTADPSCEEIIHLKAFGSFHLRLRARANLTSPPLIDQDNKKLCQGPHGFRRWGDDRVRLWENKIKRSHRAGAFDKKKATRQVDASSQSGQGLNLRDISPGQSGSSSPKPNSL